MSKLWFSGEIMPEAGCYSSPLSQDAFSRKDPFADQKGYFSLRLHFQIQGNTTVPKKEEFYSRLNDAKISGEHYGHAKRVWMEFSIKTIGDYHDLYLKYDTLYLPDVFKNFRSACIENYDLDPAWYCTAAPVWLGSPL